MGGLEDKPFPPGRYDVVVVGSGPGGLQTSYCLRRAGLGNHALLSADPEPAGMFRRFPIFERLISWTKPEAPFERGTREYEWYDHNSLLGEESEHQALVPKFMDRTFDVPSRQEMEAALLAFVDQTGLQIRFGCRWESTRREGDEFVLTTTDGEYRCRAVVFAIGVTDPWKSPIPGAESAPHYVETRPANAYKGKRVFIIGKRNSGFEIAHGLLPWAREIVLASPRPVQTARLALSPLRVRYLQPYDEYVRGGSGAFVLDAAIERVEGGPGSYRILTNGTTYPGEREFEADEVIVATGFRAPLRDLAELGVATVADGRVPAQTAFWESVSVPGVYFAGNVTQGSPGLRKQGLSSSSTSVNGFRYNARVLAQHLAEARFGLVRERPVLRSTDLVSYLLSELARAPELWIQKGYLARVVSVDGTAARNEGILPLQHFVDSEGPDAVAVTVELDREATIYPAVYVRRAGRIDEFALPSNPLNDFETAEHRAELESRLAPFLQS